MTILIACLIAVTIAWWVESLSNDAVALRICKFIKAGAGTVAVLSILI